MTAGWSWRVLLALVVLGAAAGCTGDDNAGGPEASEPPSAVDDDPTALRVGVVGLDHLDPARVLPTDQAEMLAVDLLFEGLTAWDPATGEAVPALATWEVSDDQRVWTFRLRDDAEFHDGTAVTAEDVKVSLERLVVLGPSSLAGVRLEVIEGYDAYVAGAWPELVGLVAVDDATVEVRTAGPYAPLPELLSSPLYGIVPADAVGESTLDDEPVGAGPYRLASRDEAAVRLERVGSDGPERVTLRSYPDRAAAWAAFGDGVLDWAPVPDDSVAEAVDEHGDDAVVPFDTVLFLGMNVSEAPLSDPQVRRALVRGVDRESLLEGPLVGHDPLDGAVAVGVPGAGLDACGPECAYDPTAAGLTLLGAEVTGPLAPIELGYVAEDPVQEAVVADIVEDLAEVPLAVTPVPRPFEEYRSWVVSGEQRLFMFGWAGVAITPDVYLGPLFRSGSVDNVTGYLDPLADLSLETARATADPAERRRLYGELEAFVMSSVPIVPLATVRTNAVISDRVEGYVARPDGTFVVQYVTLAD